MNLSKINEPTKRLNIIKKKYIDPLLKKEGFIKKGIRYVNTTEELEYSINIQKIGFNTKNSLDFVLNFEIYPNQERIKFLPFTFLAPLINARVFAHAPVTNQSFTLTTNDEYPNLLDQEIGEKIERVLREYTIPFLKSIQTLKDVVIYLENLRDSKPKITPLIQPIIGGDMQKWIAIVYFMINQKEKSIQILDEEISICKIEGYKKNLERLKSQML